MTDHRLWSDLDPTYLPNGEIAFVSERCGASLQCNEMDKDETSCNLYVMQPDGSRIRRLSVTKDGDYLPHCLDDGTIGYTRWEYEQRGWANIQSLWTVRPDGTGADARFKQHLNNPWALEDFRSIPGTNNSKLVAIAAGHHTLAAGPVVVITPSDGMNDPRAIRIVTPGVHPPEGGMSGSPVDEGGVADRGGFYMTPWPLSQKYFLASYSYSPAQTERAGYGIYLIDVFGSKELLYRDAGISCFVPIPLRPRPRPPVLADTTDPVDELRRVQPGGGGFRDAGDRARPGPLPAHPPGHPVALRPEVRRPALRARRQGRRELEPHPRDRHRAPGGRRQRALQGARRTRPSTSNCSTRTRWSCGGCGRSSASSRASSGPAWAATRRKAVAPPDGQFPAAMRRDPVDPVPPPWGTAADELPPRRPADLRPALHAAATAA